MRSTAAAARLALAAAAVTCLATIAACSSGGGSASSSAAATVTVTPSGTASSSPTAAPTSAPASTAAAGGGGCATSQLHVYTGNSQGAAGTIYYDLIFTNISSSSCTLYGYPGVSFVTAPNESGSQVGSDAKRNSVYPAKTITVAPGASAHALLGIAQAGNFPASSCNQVSTQFMKVFPPNETVAAYFPFATQTCASTSQPTMRVSTITTGS